MFAQLAQHFAEGIPNSDEPLRAHLIRQLGFTKKGADECISSFRETHRFLEAVGLPQSNFEDGQGTPVEDLDLAKAESIVQSQAPNVAVTLPNPAAAELLVVPLTKDCRVEMHFYGPISERALAKLSRYIDLMQEDWAEDD